MGTVLTAKNLSYAYDGETAVEGLRFEVVSGDYLCIIGENGSGKSTLLKGLLRLKQPSAGELLFEDGLKPNEIGYLPQQTSAQKDFPASCFEVVLSGFCGQRGILPFYTARQKRAARENMERLDCANLSRRGYRDLSGGQQQRILLARALCATKRLLLLDEPMAGLDPLVTQDLYKQIADINRDLGLTIIMVSHDVKTAMQYAKTILHLKKEQLFFGATQTYLESDVGKQFFGGAA
ncbi:MAG: metal ABC transporter ATP-binding protein [Oscillospiraceae bacterium]|nr:metal ABC transporter ATP-binding protein [Oscillospiraceae bacterium]